MQVTPVFPNGIPFQLRELEVLHYEYEDNSDSAKYPIRDIMQAFGDKYLELYRPTMSDEQVKALKDIRACKTGKAGFSASYCPKCKLVTIHNASCGNRACGCCQQMDAAIWSEKRMGETIEGLAYYHSVGTIPSEMYPLALANPDVIYPLLLSNYGKTIVQLCQDSKYGGYTPSVLIVLHTWKSNLGYHPHAHAVISGGGLSIGPVPKFVEASHRHFLVPSHVIASLFRGKFMADLQACYENNELKLPSPESMNGIDLSDPVQWANFRDDMYNKAWHVDVRETFNGHGNAIRYLGRYVYRTAISNARIVSFTVDEEHPDGLVVFKYKDYRTDSKMKETSCTALEFIHNYLMHVLPKGLCRVRYFGLLSNSVKAKNLALIARLQGRILTLSWVVGKSRSEVAAVLLKNDSCFCPICKGKLVPLPNFSPGDMQLSGNLGNAA